METFLAVIGDVLDALAGSGFRRILVVNGHGGNSPAQAFVAGWTAERAGVQVRFHNWWNAPLTIAQVKAIDPVASHASWMENFGWTRVAGASMPDAQKPMVDWARLQTLDPAAIRAELGDGNFGGRYQRADSEMAVWRVAVAETRAQLTDGW